MDIINRVYQWNEQRGLLEKPYRKELESSFVAEELSELLRGDSLADDVDAYIDSIIFQLGALAKILKDVDAVKECFTAVLIANDAKGLRLDKSGKVLKDRATFKDPSEVIEAVLNRVTK